jgi:spore coat protein B
MFYPMFRYGYGGKHLGALAGFVGKYVKINRGGPESIEGRLIAVHSDYGVLLTKDGIVYVNAAHIKSITEAKGAAAGGRTGGRSVRYIVAHSFNDVLRRLRQHFVQINQGGPEKVTGFIAEVGMDTLLLVAGKEVISIPLFHIRTVSLAQRSGGSSGSKSDDGKQRSQGGASQGGSRGRQGGSKGHQGGRGGASGGKKN